MKKIILFVVLCYWLANANIEAQPWPWPGEGTELEPFQISSLQCWEQLRDSVLHSPNNQIGVPGNWSYGKFFELTQDITDTIKFVIGGNHYAHSTNIAFEGNFDGKGHKMTLGIQNARGALFSRVSGVTIKNLTTDGWVSGSMYAASLIANCNNFLIIHQTGIMWNSIINCVNLATITGGVMAGGFAADVYRTNFISCINAGTINGQLSGGIVACLASSDTMLIKNCHNIGNVFSGTNGQGAGGIVGLHGASRNVVGQIIDCNNSGFVCGGLNTGGIVGVILDNSNTIISNCINTGVVIGNGNVGCITGDGCIRPLIEDCYWDKQTCPHDD